MPKEIKVFLKMTGNLIYSLCLLLAKEAKTNEAWQNSDLYV